MSLRMRSRSATGRTPLASMGNHFQRLTLRIGAETIASIVYGDKEAFMLNGMGNNWKKLWIILFITVVPPGIFAQDVEAKLAQRADFIPATASVHEQLVQVAQHYRIPMGIEWVVQAEEEHAPVAGSTVMALLSSILQSAPNYSITVRNGVVNVSDSRYAADSGNFLNLWIGDFSLVKANVFDASAELRFKIHKILVAANGNTLWLADIAPSRMMKN